MTKISASSPRTYALTISYDGTRYAGWQVQPRVRTIQGELERSVQRLVASGDDQPVRILGSGRTDAGVHAIGQVARCVLPEWKASPEALRAAINSRLPNDILVRRVAVAPNGFHPIADAIGKTYRYYIQIGGDRHPFNHRYTHRVGREIDLDLMQQAAAKFLGQHDFAAFQAAGAERNSTVRTLTLSRWSRPTEMPLTMITPESQWRVYEVEGNGFLYNMVRNLVGTMIEVGRGYRSLDWIDEVIASRDRKTAGPTAPPQGLFLFAVRYPRGLF